MLNFQSSMVQKLEMLMKIERYLAHLKDPPEFRILNSEFYCF